MIDVEELLDHQQHLDVPATVEPLRGCRAGRFDRAFEFRFPVPDDVGRDTEQPADLADPEISLVGNRCIHAKNPNACRPASDGPATCG